MPAERPLKFTGNVDRLTIEVATASPSSKVLERSLDRPGASADILHDKFCFVPQQSENRTVAVVPVLLLQNCEFVRDALQGLRCGGEQEGEPFAVESQGGFGGITLRLHVDIYATGNFDDLVSSTSPKPPLGRLSMRQ
jgi:hypothetical protein